MQKQEIHVNITVLVLKRKTKQNYASIKNKEFCVDYKCKVIPIPV